MWFYLDGEFVDEEHAVVPVTDRAFLYGDGCFEGVGVFDGRIPHLDEHVARLYRSAASLRIPMSISQPELRAAILETARRNAMQDSGSAYLRPLVSRGSGPLGVGNTARIGPTRVLIIPQLSGRTVEFGANPVVLSAVVTRWQRATSASLDPAIKSNNYLSSILAYLEAAERGADVGVLTDQDGGICEGHAMNIFCVSDGEVRTPRSTLVLRGITRHYVMRLARENGIACREADLSAYDLETADEVFVTSAMESVAPVGQVNGLTIGTGTIGPLTARLREVYLEYAWETGTEISTGG